MTAPLAAVLLLAQAPTPVRPSRPSSPSQTQVRPEDLGGISGQVVSGVDSSPLRKATLTLRATDSGRESPFVTTTDAAGRFDFRQVPPGRYDLSAERNGFVTWYIDSKRTGGTGQRLTLGKAERLTNFPVRMIPQAVVTGRVTDEDGEPMIRVQVQLKRVTYSQGKREWTAWGSSSSTDDRGEYRIHGVVPGKYVLSASQGGFREGAAGPRPGGQSARDTRPDEVYPPAYFPASADPDHASLLDVQPGGTLSGIDFRLRKTPTVRVRGRVVRPMEARRPAMIMLLPGRASASTSAEAIRTMADSSGTFELRGVLPGSYLLHGEDWDREKPLSGNLLLEVGRNHLDGIQVRLLPGVELTGQLLYEDTTEKPTGNPYIGLRETATRVTTGSPLKADGTFLMKSVRQGNHAVTLGNIPAGFYLKSLKSGDLELADQTLAIGEAPPAPLRILLSPHAGQIEGTVSRDQKPVSGSTVVLWPVGNEPKPRLHRTANTDASGHFVLKDLPPGDYRLAAISGLENGAWQDPDALKPFESKADRVTIQEKARETKMLSELTL